MKFEYHQIDTLPKLAWCAIMSAGGNIATVYHGPWVEVNERFFVEGAWDGKFNEGDLSRAFLAGSGATITAEGILFCTPSHVLSRLYFGHFHDRLYISPSLSFVLTQSNNELDLNHISYHADILKMTQSLTANVGSIPLRNGRLNVAHFRNLLVNGRLTVEPVRKPEPRDFIDFVSYKQFLLDGLKRLAENFRCPSRRVSYEPIATLSTGYDSVACAALATEIGCVKAATFRRGTTGTDDNGRRIAERLGMTAFEFDREAILTKAGLPEAEFVGGANTGEDCVMTAMEDVYQQRFVIMGVHGDNVWDRVSQRVRRDITRHTFFNIEDYRLRVGFSILPLPFMGCLSHPSIYRISNSSEMKPWALGTHYDRPIPRRIAEEKGVERHLFGQTKKATTIYFSGHRSMLSKMNPVSARSFEDYYQQNKHRRSRLKQTFHYLLYYLYALQYATIDVDKIPCPIPDRYRRCPGRPSFLVHWGLAHIRERYRVAETLDQASGAA
jgi:hypothetical protein